MSHQRMKHHLFYTFLAIFIATAVIALLGIIGALKIPDFYLKSLTTALLIELVGAVIALYQKADFFEPESRTEFAAEPHEKAGKIEQETFSRLSKTLPKHDASTLEEESVTQVKDQSYKITHEETLKPALLALKSAPSLLAKQLETARSFMGYLLECERQVPAAELDLEAIFNRFIGLPVSWPLKIESIKFINQDYADIIAFDGVVRINSGPVKTVDHPEIKLLRKGEEIVLSGHLAKIHDKFYYTLTNSRIQTAP
jgi:hypothetical protein